MFASASNQELYPSDEDDDDDEDHHARDKLVNAITEMDYRRIRAQGRIFKYATSSLFILERTEVREAGVDAVRGAKTQVEIEDLMGALEHDPNLGGRRVVG